MTSKLTTGSDSSRSSRLRATDNQQIKSSSDDGSTKDIKQVYDHFHALGMTVEITMEVFERLFVDLSMESSPTGNGGTNLKEALLFLSERLVGRQAASRARGIIARAREDNAKSRPVSKIKAPSSKPRIDDDVLSDPMKNALVKRESVYRVLTMGIRNEYEVARKEMGILDAQKRELEIKLEEKRRISLLMDVLERREAVRLARLGADKGMGNLIGNLRKETYIAMQDFQRVSEPSQSEDMSSSSNTALLRRAVLERSKGEAWKYRCTTEALANLHALHVKRTSTGHDDKSANRPNVDKRLEAVLNRLGVRDSRGVTKMKQKLVEVARRRADSKTVFCPKADGRNVGNLNDAHRKLEEKQSQVQEKVNRAVALGSFCDEYIDLISTFRTETASALSGMLEDERNRVAGYVDVLLASTLRPSAKLGEWQLFETEVRNIIGSKKMTICEDVRDLVERVKESEEILKTTPTLIREKDVDGVFGDQYLEDWNVSTQKNRRVLERKGKKAEYGFEIAKDINSLLEHFQNLK